MAKRSRVVAQNPRLKRAKRRSAIAVWSMRASVHHDNFSLKNGTWNNFAHADCVYFADAGAMLTKMALQTLGSIAETGTSEAARGRGDRVT